MADRHVPRAWILMPGVFVAFAACSPDATSPDTMEPFEGGPAALVVPGPDPLIVQLCKIALDPTDGTLGEAFDFENAASAGNVLANATLVAQDLNALDFSLCAMVWTRPATAFDDETQLSITEVIPDGFALGLVTGRPQGAVPDGATCDPFIFELDPPIEGPTSVTLNMQPRCGYNVFFKNVQLDSDLSLGRMTGGGRQDIAVGNLKITRGLTVHCDITLSNNLQINWQNNRWHLDKPLTSARCFDDPAIVQAPPAAPLDTFIGEGFGRLNNVDGSFVRFTFVDAGEPGRNDHSTIQIWAPGADPSVDAPILDISGFLNHGNFQAHYDQPHGSNK